jgi:drug/metabolite transporter (DMT)-like permease
VRGLPPSGKIPGMTASSVTGPETALPDRVTLAAFGAASLIGGMNFVAVRFSNRELPPYFGAGTRFALAALVLLVVMRMRRIPFPRGASLGVTLIYGVLSFTIAYALAYWAMQPGKLSAGMGAVVFAATPLITLLLASLHGIERLRIRSVVGSVMAIAGIGILAGSPGGAAAPLVPLGAMLLAAVAAAEASVMLKRFPPAHPAATNGTAMAVGAALLLTLSALSGESWALPEQSSTWIAVSYLAVVGSAGLFGLFLFTLARWTASAVAYMTALFPIVAMTGGALIAGEAITANGVIGGAVVLAGLYTGTLMRRRAPRERPPSLKAEPRPVAAPGELGCG